jgi:hypothetical protein
MAFYRLLFFAESTTTPLPENAAEHTAFSAAILTERSIDLGRPPFDRDAGLWAAPAQFGACQDLADMAREAGIEAIRYRSVRDPQGRANLALLTCRAFASRAPLKRQSWRIRLTPGGALAVCEFPELRLAFTHADFAGDPRLAQIAG